MVSLGHYDRLPNFVFGCHPGTIFELLSFWIFDIATFDHCQLATDSTALTSPPLFLTDAATLDSNIAVFRAHLPESEKDNTEYEYEIYFCNK